MISLACFCSPLLILFLIPRTTISQIYPERVNVEVGKGFDFKEQSHLKERFGFGNICTNWDYTPARELTAVYYPVFEYSLLVYLCLDFVVTYLSYKRKEICGNFYKFSKFVFGLNIFLCTQFRKLFVVRCSLLFSFHCVLLLLLGGCVMMTPKALNHFKFDHFGSW